MRGGGSFERAAFGEMDFGTADAMRCPEPALRWYAVESDPVVYSIVISFLNSDKAIPIHLSWMNADTEL